MRTKNTKQPAAQAVTVQRLVGMLGEFTAASGYICQCRVIDQEGEILAIEYVSPRTGQKFSGAFIGITEFRPDEHPNDALCDGGPQSIKSK